MASHVASLPAGLLAGYPLFGAIQAATKTVGRSGSEKKVYARSSNLNSNTTGVRWMLPRQAVVVEYLVKFCSGAPGSKLWNSNNTYRLAPVDGSQRSNWTVATGYWKMTRRFQLSPRGLQVRPCCMAMKFHGNSLMRKKFCERFTNSHAPG